MLGVNQYFVTDNLSMNVILVKENLAVPLYQDMIQSYHVNPKYLLKFLCHILCGKESLLV